MNRLSAKLLPLLVLVAVFLLQWLLLFTLKEPTWDAVSYYAYARSLVFDRDLDFANDYLLSYPTAGEHFASRAYHDQLTSNGRVANLFAMGAGLLWLPWLAVLRLASAVAPGLTAAGGIPTGYEQLFVGNLSLFSALLGLAAYWLSLRLARAISSPAIALAATVTLMFATPLLYYQYREPLYSHTAAAFTVALVVLLWWQWQTAAASNKWTALLLGGLIGLAGLVRWQNLIYLALPAFSSGLAWLRLPRARRDAAWKEPLVQLLLVGAGTLAVFALQMVVWGVLYGSFVTIPQGSGFIDWRGTYLWPLLFSSFRGLLPWMPVFFLAGGGLLALSWRRPQVGIPLLGMLLLALYVNGSTRDWFAGGGFGPRRLTSELVLLVVGYAAFLQLLPARGRAATAVLLGLLLALHQWLLLRYALPESLGGRVMSMMPAFEWEEVPLATFVHDLGALLPRVLADPLDLLILSGSPLDVLLRQGGWPGMHLAVLLATGLFAAGLVGLIWVVGRPARRGAGYGYLVLLGGAGLLLANLWLWQGA